MPHIELTQPTRGLNLACLVKGEERYVIAFRDADRPEALRQLGRWASHPDLSFTRYDAGILAARIRRRSPGA